MKIIFCILCNTYEWIHNELTLYGGLVLEKLTVVSLVKKPPSFMYRSQKSRPQVTILSDTNTAHILLLGLLKFHFNIILLTMPVTNQCLVQVMLLHFILEKCLHITSTTSMSVRKTNQTHDYAIDPPRNLWYILYVHPYPY